MEEEKLSFAEIMKGFAEIRQTLDRIGEKQEKNAELIGGIGNSNGAFAEEFFFSSLVKSKTFAGIHFDEVDENFKRSKKMPDGTMLKDQFDIVMTNDEAIAIIEIKYRAKKGDLRKIAEKKASNFRALFSDYNDYKIYLGLGAMSFDEFTVNEAEDYGIGLMKISGDTVEYKTDWVRAY